jgi:hypothetical protein
VPYLITNEVGVGAIDCCRGGRTRSIPRDAPITLSSGAEMRLIEAEHALIDGDIPGAVALINQLRTAAGVPTVTATTAADAWTELKRERGIVLWLEGRRMNDFRRWAEDGRPGALHPLEMPSGDPAVGSHLAQQDLCFPIPPSEQDTNPNIS